MGFKWWIKLRLHVANNQTRMNLVMQHLSLIISMVVVIALLLYHGFYFTNKTQYYIRSLIYVSLWFYIVKYWLLCFYSMDKWGYIKSSFFEFMIILILILHFISISILPIEIDFLNTDKFNRYYLLGIQFYFLIIAVVELSKSTSIYKKLNFSPPKLMLFSFLALIVMGTALLMMPQMTKSGISLIDALFTATSASCVTGLTTLSVSSTFTLKGLIVIMILTQLGGMSILTFAAFFTTFLYKSSTGLRYQHLIKDMMATNRLSDSYSLLKDIIITTLSIEVVGVFLLYIYWKNTGYFLTNGDAFFYAIFHAVSAFNNAGFTLWDANFMHSSMIHSYFPQLIIMLLVISGGIGFFTLTDIFSPKSIINRRKYPWKKLMPGTKIVLKTTFFLIIVGATLFFIIEYNNSLSSHDTFFSKAFAAFFQIVVSRTSGFNTINVSRIAVPGILLLLALMFIGASPGSTGGGIKNTTFFVVMKSVMATIKGKKHIEFEKKTIPFDLVDRAYSIVIMSLMLICLSVFILTLIEPEFQFTTILFEATSAFTTTGLSMGAAAQFSWAGKFILILNMYVGRIGTLTMAFALSKRSDESQHQYPETTFMVG